MLGSMSVQLNGQVSGKLPLLLNCLPDRVAFPSHPDSGRYAFVTITGQRLGDVTGWRVSSNGVPQDGLIAQRQEVNITKPNKGTRKSLSFDPAVSCVLKLMVNGPVPNGEFALEGLVGKQWIKTPLVVVVGPPSAEASIKVGQPPMMAEDPLAEKLKVRNELEREGATDEFLVSKATNAAMVRLQVELDKLKENPYHTANILDYYPKEAGQLEGYLVLIGTGLDSIKDVRIGNTPLGRVHKKLRWKGQEKYVYYFGARPLTGPLTVEKPVKIGPRVTRYQQVLEPSYSLQDRSQMEAKVEFVEIHPVNGMGTKIYPYQPATVRVRFENVPGTHFFETNDWIAFNSTTVAFQGEPRFVADEKLDDGRPIYYGNMFEVTFTCRSNHDLTKLGFNFNFTALDLNKAGFAHRVAQRLTYPLAERVEYVIENTASIKELLDFDLTSWWGSAEGISYGANPFSSEDDVRVGPMEIGGDLAFRIASGPVGTRGQWTSDAIKLKEGWTVESVTYDILNVGDNDDHHGRDAIVGLIRLGQPRLLNRLIRIPASPADNSEFEPNLNFYSDRCLVGCEYSICDTASRFWYCVRGTYIPVDGDPMDLYMRPLQVGLELESAWTNDHRVTFVIKTIKLHGPPGRDPTEAFEVRVYPEIKYSVAKDCSGEDRYPIQFR